MNESVSINLQEEAVIKGDLTQEVARNGARAKLFDPKVKLAEDRFIINHG